MSPISWKYYFIMYNEQMPTYILHCLWCVANNICYIWCYGIDSRLDHQESW